MENTSSSVLTGWKVSSLRTSSGISSMSASLSFGRMMCLIPARCAPRTFSFRTADGQHSDAKRELARHSDVAPPTGRPLMCASTSAVDIVVPADGPSPSEIAP